MQSLKKHHVNPTCFTHSSVCTLVQDEAKASGAKASDVSLQGPGEEGGEDCEEEPLEEDPTLDVK